MHGIINLNTRKASQLPYDFSVSLEEIKKKKTKVAEIVLHINVLSVTFFRCFKIQNEVHRCSKRIGGNRKCEFLISV